MHVFLITVNSFYENIPFNYFKKSSFIKVIFFWSLSGTHLQSLTSATNEHGDSSPGCPLPVCPPVLEELLLRNMMLTLAKYCIKQMHSGSKVRIMHSCPKVFHPRHSSSDPSCSLSHPTWVCLLGSQSC